MRMRKKKWVAPFLLNEKDYLISDLNDFKTTLPVYLEIGMGMGDFITISAFEHPEIFYIGLEKDETCVAKTIIKAREKELKNLKILHIDAAQLPEVFAGRSIDRIYLPFSDPWPKKHHHKRRLTFPTFLKLYDSVLKDDGDIIFKSDNVLLYNDTLEYIKDSAFEIAEKDEDYHRVKRSEPLTAYEKKFSELGQPIYYLRLVKKS